MLANTVKYIALLGVLLLGHASITAQTPKLDSLKVLLDASLEDSNRVNILNAYGKEYFRINPDTSIYFSTQALQLAEKIKWKLGEGLALCNLGVFVYYKSEYDLSLQHYMNALAICNELEKAPFNSKAAIIKLKIKIHVNLAMLYRVMGEYLKALEYDLKALQMLGASGDRQGLESILLSIGNDYLYQCDYNKALDYFLRGSKIAEQTGDKYIISTYLGNIGVVYEKQSDYPKALEYYVKALRMTQESGDKNGEAMHLNNIGIIYSSQGNYSKSSDYHFKALQIDEKLGNPNSIASDYTNIATNYSDQGDFQKALEFNLKALGIMEEIEYKFGVASVHASIGGIYENQNDHLKALDYFNKSLVVMKELGEKNGIASNLNNIGAVYINQNKLKEAESYLKQALALSTEIGSVERVRESNENLSELYGKQGAWDKSLFYSYQSFHASKSFLLNNLSSLSESEKSAFLKIFSDNSNNPFSRAFNFRSAPDSLLQWLYEYQLFRRGIVLESSAGLASSVQKNAAVKSLWETFSVYKKVVGQEYLKPVDERRADLTVVEDSVSILEKEMLAQSAPYRNWKDRLNTTWQEVQKKLGNDEAAVEFVSFQRRETEATDSVCYAALVLTSKMKYPKLIYLFEEKQLSGILQNISSASTSGISNLYTAMRGIKVINVTAGAKARLNGDSLYTLIWQPLAPYLKDVKSISYVPDGLLNKISMAAIPNPNGKPMSEMYRLKQMASTRSIAFPSEEPKWHPAAFYGGIDYTYSLPGNMFKQHDSTSISLLELASRGNRGSEFVYLEGTKEEAAGLSNIYKRKGFSYQLIEGKNATEKAFKKMDGKSPAVLHLATHGYFFPTPDNGGKHSGGVESNYSLAEDPLLRSGLVLAGGNYAWKNGSNSYEEEDGILTAYEIAHLNLSTTDIVVLSACETGLGDIKGSEGVYGLQRAFKMAGVKYIVMSLWQVPDKETKEFMQMFYSKWLNGNKIRDAFRETQQEMAAKYEPFKWAAFVLVE